MSHAQYLFADHSLIYSWIPWESVRFKSHSTLSWGLATENTPSVSKHCFNQWIYIKYKTGRKRPIYWSNCNFSIRVRVLNMQRISVKNGTKQVSINEKNNYHRVVWRIIRNDSLPARLISTALSQRKNDKIGRPREARTDVSWNRHEWEFVCIFI